ncbi:MAG: ribosome recycling factor [Armatimonadetes bacterium]|nr:ribosome recycling factor [Armatimonadota bacterium]
MIDLVLSEAEEKMKKAIEALRHEMSTIRTGRANPALLDRVQVEYYGSALPVNQVATISVPEPRLLMIAPWDKGALGPIERAIIKSDLGLNPTNDGNVIRLSIPYLTEERRRDLIKILKKYTEEGKVAIRNIRREANENLKSFEKEHEISEDDCKRGQEQVQKLTDKHIAEVDALEKAKEAELLEV